MGWNNSLTTQRDVEKSLNCCGFSHMDVNGSCAAVISSDTQVSLFFCSVPVSLHVLNYINDTCVGDNGCATNLHADDSITNCKCVT